MTRYPDLIRSDPACSGPYGVTMRLRLLSLYPDQMNIYADRGNLTLLRKRCEWRGIEFTVTGCGLGEEFDHRDFDLIYMGGGQDRDQKAVAGDLVRTKREQMAADSWAWL